MTALFWVIAAALATGVVAVIVYPLLARRVRTGLSSDAINTSLYAEQLAELDTDLRTGTVAQG